MPQLELPVRHIGPEREPSPVLPPAADYVFVHPDETEAVAEWQYT